MKTTTLRGFAPVLLLTSVPLPVASIGILALLFFVTSTVGVVTGSNSLITVPAMFQFGIDPRVAVATNMFGLTFMAVGGTLPFVGKGLIDRRRSPWLIGLTLAGSTIGALLVFVVPGRTMPLIISVAMISVALFTLLKRKVGVIPPEDPPTLASESLGYAITFALAIYGGFFSGGYVTMLTATFVAVFRMTFVQAVSTTKLVNVFSSGIATVVFVAQEVVDYKLGLILGVAMFAGAFAGARVALRLNNIWLRRVFIWTVIALGLKMLLYDFIVRG